VDARTQFCSIPQECEWGMVFTINISQWFSINRCFATLALVQLIRFVRAPLERKVVCAFTRSFRLLESGKGLACKTIICTCKNYIVTPPLTRVVIMVTIYLSTTSQPSLFYYQSSVQDSKLNCCCKFWCRSAFLIRWQLSSGVSYIISKQNNAGVLELE